MSDLIQNLINKRANAWEHAKALLESADTEGRGFSAEEESTWQAANADISALDERIKSLVDAEKRSADTAAAFAEIQARPAERATGGTELSQDEAALRFFSGQTVGKSFEVRGEGRMGSEEARTLSKLSAAAGANTVKTSFYEKLQQHMIEVSGIRQAGTTPINTTTGEAMQFPKTTAHSTAALVAEAGTIGVSEPTFGQITLDAYKYAFLMQLSSELINDTSVDLLGYISMQAGRALGNAVGTHLVTGTGSSQPNGVVTATSAGVTGGTGVAGVPTYDNLVDLHYSVISPYRASASCSWVIRDSTEGAFRKIKDSQNRPLWEPGLTVGAPNTLLGKPIFTDPNVAATGLSAKSVLFGDFSQYLVRQVNGIRFERSDDYAFNTDLVTYRAIVRADGDLIDTTGCIKQFVGGAS